jgi:hypothetical protein
MKDLCLFPQVAVSLKKRALPLYPSRSKLTRTITFIFVVCTLLLFPSRVGAAPLSSYSCVGHCYGLVDWYGGVTGAATSIFTNRMYAGDDHVNNEMWLNYNDSSGHTIYWVEVGTKAEVGAYNGNEILFWDDNRPNGGFTRHLGPQLNASDFGKYGFFEISKDSSSSFFVYAGNLPVAAINMESTANPINPNDINIGMELVGSSGATAPINGFTDNQSQNSNGWFYQPIRGKVYTTPNSPVRTLWKYPPAGNGSNSGGEFNTCLNSNCPF